MPRAVPAAAAAPKPPAAANAANAAAAPVPTRPSSLIEKQPGISASDVAKSMKIKPNYLYRVLGDLEKEGRVKKEGRQYYPAG